MGNPPIFPIPMGRTGGSLFVTTLDAHPALAMSYEIYQDRLPATGGRPLAVGWRNPSCGKATMGTPSVGSGASRRRTPGRSWPAPAAPASKWRPCSSARRPGRTEALLCPWCPTMIPLRMARGFSSIESVCDRYAGWLDFSGGEVRECPGKGKGRVIQVLSSQRR